MWTLKEKTTKRWTQEELNQYNESVAAPNRLPVGRLLQIELFMTFTDGKQDIAVSTWVSTADEIKKAIQQNLDRLNEQEEAIKKVENDTILDEEVTEPTAEEIAAKEAAEAKQIWQAKRQALKAMREDMQEAKDLGVDPTTEQLATMKAMAEWIRDNATEEFYS